MTSSAVQHLSKIILGALLAFVVSSTGFPTVARGGCQGQYLSEHANTEKPRAVFLDLLEGSGALVNVSDQAPSEPPSPPPCRGAFCSGRPSAPTSPLPPSSSEYQHEWALPLFEVPLQPDRSFARESVAFNQHPSGPARSIFHPPRF